MYCEPFGQEGMSQAHFNLSGSRFHEPAEIHPQELPCKPISIKLTLRDRDWLRSKGIASTCSEIYSTTPECPKYLKFYTFCLTTLLIKRSPQLNYLCYGHVFDGKLGNFVLASIKISILHSQYYQ